jgi:WD40 repeat protein
VRRVIDEEVQRLPEKYRVPFVLFHLEGRSSAEVAHELGCPLGTAESWLTRARERLRTGLSRRGVHPSAGLFAALAPQGWLPSAAARAALAAGQGPAGAVSTEAAALAGELLRTLGLVKLKSLGAVLLLGAFVAAVAGLAARTAPSAEPSPRPTRAETVRSEEPAPPEKRPEQPVQIAEPVKMASFRNEDRTGIRSVAFSPDGKTVAAGGALNGQVRLWDVETGKVRLVLHQATTPRNIDCVVYSPDGRTIASGGTDRTIKLWDAVTGKEQGAFRETIYIYSLAFSPDGKLLASAGGLNPVAERSFRSLSEVPKEMPPEIGQVRVWDLETGQERTFYRGEVGRIHSLAFSPDGTTLAGGARDGAVRLWDVSSGKEIACLQESAAGVRGVAFSPDGKTLAALQCDQGDQIKLWDLTTGKVRARLRNDGLYSVLAFAPDGTLAAGSDIPPADPQRWNEVTGEVRLWDPAGQPRGAPLTFPHRSSSLSFSADGKVLAVGGDRAKDGEITLWNLAPRRPSVP